VIRDARVLQPEFIPNEVAHRDAEVNHLSRTLDPLTDGDPPETPLLLGPSGTGKTCIARFTVDRLRETMLEIEYQYVNCWQDYTRFRLLYRLLDGVGRTLDVHRRSTPKDELLDRLHAYDGEPYVVILDEVDQLESTAVLYDLHRIRGLHPILIANREPDLFSRLDDRVRSRLQSSIRIRFDKYGVDELVAILSDRVRWGLDEDVVGEPALRYIADAAAGDARVSIGILRTAAREAQSRGLDRIPMDVVEEAVPEGKSALKQKDLQRLTPHQRTVYEIVAERGAVTPGALYDAYRDRVEEPKTKRTVRNYCSKLEQYNLVRAEGEKRGRRYRLAARAPDPPVDPEEDPPA
jgi:orc1/cdc6 family replication initiation protein